MINLETYLIESCPTYEDGVRYLRNKYSNNYKRFIERFINPLRIWLSMNDVPNIDDIISIYLNLWSRVKSFSYKEAFEIKDGNFRALVFSVIDVPEMIKHLGSKRIKTDGIELENKAYDKTFKLSQVYELHKVDCSELEIEEDVFAIRCWCTSTNTEHWLWIDKKEGLKNDPLSAIASTCKVYKSMIGNIKHIIRQGDVFIFEMKNDNFVPKEDEEIVSLDKNTYFNLLKCQA